MPSLEAAIPVTSMQTPSTGVLNKKSIIVGKKVPRDNGTSNSGKYLRNKSVIIAQIESEELAIVFGVRKCSQVHI